jgi:hypothetical protein
MGSCLLTAMQVSRTFLMTEILNRHLEESRILHNKSLTKQLAQTRVALLYSVFILWQLNYFHVTGYTFLLCLILLHCFYDKK